jgi:predicted ATPase
MNLIYLWVRKYKNIETTGFNLSGKVSLHTTIESTDSDGTLNLNLSVENEYSLDILPENIIDIKAVLGQNGSGKSNLLFSLTNFLMNNQTKFFGFLVTADYIIVRDKINFTQIPDQLLGKKIKILEPHDIVNYTRGHHKAEVSKEDAFGFPSNNLMETYFQKNYIISYSPAFNQDNIFNSEGVQNSYALHQSSAHNYFDLSTESLMIGDYNAHKNNTDYMISGESELLSFKSWQSIRDLNFLSIEKQLNLTITFPIHNIDIGFTGYNAKYWQSIDFLTSGNFKENTIIEKYLSFHRFDLFNMSYKNQFLIEYSKEIMYCVMSYELKYYYSSPAGAQIPVRRLINNLRDNYNSNLTSYRALYSYIIKCSLFEPEDADFIIDQIKKAKSYFEDKIKSGEILCGGMHGLSIPESSVRNIIKDFMQGPLFELKTSLLEQDDDDVESIKLNIFEFNLHGLSSGERTFLSLFSRLNYIKNRIETRSGILFLIDEGELGFHPQWQKEYLMVLTDFLNKFFPNNQIQLILTSHSPFLASDLPKENIIFLELDENLKTKISDLEKHQLTFASNIHSLYSDAFFLKGATIGSFSKTILNEIIDYLKSNEFSASKNERYRQIIQVIGEPVIKRKMEDLWMQKLGRDEEIQMLKDRIKYLESL